MGGNQEVRRDWNLVKQSWKVAEVTQLLGKIQRNIMKRTQLSRVLRVNLMPTKVSYADAVKALVVILWVMRELEKRYGNPKLMLVRSHMNLLLPGCS